MADSKLRSRVQYEKLPTREESLPLETSSHKYNLSKFKLDDWAATTMQVDIPWGAIALAIFLLIFGLLCFVIAWLHVSQEILGKEQAEIGFTVLGFMTFIPGFYHCRIAYYAMKGYHGYSFDSIPKL